MSNRSDPNSVYILPGDPEKETYRLSTFIKFPQGSFVDQVILARHGWLYTGCRDCTKCFSCGATKQDWSEQDNPQLTKWHNQGCELVLGTDTRNQPIVDYLPIQFVGTIEQSTASPSNEYSSSSANSSRMISSSSPVGSENSSTLPSVSPTFTNSVSRSNGIARSLNDEPTQSQSLPAMPNAMENLNVAQIGQPRSMSYNAPFRRPRSLSIENSTSPMNSSCPAGPCLLNPEERRRQMREFPCLRPAHADMRTFADRLRTFDWTWPSCRINARKEDIADAGFYFLGKKDRAQCWYCHGGLQNWNFEDDPFIEHAKYFPGCEYLLQCKGVEFVRNVVARYPDVRRPVIRDPRFDVRTGQVVDVPSAIPPRPTVAGPRTPPDARAPHQSSVPSISGLSASLGSLSSQALRDDVQRRQAAGSTRQTEESSSSSASVYTENLDSSESEDDHSILSQSGTATSILSSGQAYEIQSSLSPGSSPYSSIISSSRHNSFLETSSDNGQQRSIIAQLEDMGFDKAKIQDAVRKNGSASPSRLVDYLLSLNKEKPIPFTTPDLSAESTLPLDPPTLRARDLVSVSCPMPEHPPPTTIGLTKMRSRHLSMAPVVDHPYVISLRDPPANQEDTEGCDIMVMRNVSQQTAQECIRGFFQSPSGKKK